MSEPTMNDLIRQRAKVGTLTTTASKAPNVLGDRLLLFVQRGSAG